MTVKGKKRVLLQIRDTGYGIDEANFHHIFDPFFTTKNEGEGTGLGLSIVYNIIQKHHGNIQVNSEVGKGTEVIIALPIEQNKV